MALHTDDTIQEANSVMQFSPGSLVVSRPVCGGKRVGAHIEVVVTAKSRLDGEAIAFFDENMKRTTYKRSVGAIIRPTAYGAGYLASDSGFVKVCWED